MREVKNIWKMFSPTRTREHTSVWTLKKGMSIERLSSSHWAEKDWKDRYAISRHLHPAPRKMFSLKRILFLCTQTTNQSQPDGGKSTRHLSFNELYEGEILWERFFSFWWQSKSIRSVRLSWPKRFDDDKDHFLSANSRRRIRNEFVEWGRNGDSTNIDHKGQETLLDESKHLSFSHLTISSSFNLLSEHQSKIHSSTDRDTFLSFPRFETNLISVKKRDRWLTELPR